MWKQKIGISVGSRYCIPTVQAVELLAKIGFDAISPEWNDREQLGDIVACARQNGMAVQSLHAPFGKANVMWSHDPSVSQPALDELLLAADACKELQIPVMVAHAWIGFDYTFDAENLHFDNYDTLVRRAQQNGIQIAFENTEGEEFLFALLDRYKNNPTVGFCWDAGHEMCYNRGEDLLAQFGDRLLMTHLNDNLGVSRFDGKTFWTDDLHLLPFDGIADWDYNVQRLQKARKLDYLNFELNIQSKPNRHENDVYANMPIELYFTEAYKRACRIAYKYQK